MNKVKSFFTKNLLWKILSLFIGIGLWIVGINVYNPFIFRTIQVPLTILNEGKLLSSKVMFKNRDTVAERPVTVRVSGRALEFENPDNAAAIVATIDLGLIEYHNLASATRNVLMPTDVSVSVPSAFTLIEHQGTVDIILDNIKDKEIKIAVDLDNTSPRDGYKTGGTISVTPEKVVVRGAEADIANIAKAEAVVRVTGSSTDVVRNASVKLYNDYGNDISSSFTFISGDVATVTVPIYKQQSASVTMPPVKYAGSPRLGFAVDEAKIEWTPKTIDIVGAASEIDKIEEVMIDAINVTNAAETIVEVVDIRKYLSTKVFVDEDGSNEVTVTIPIEPILTKDVSIPVERITALNMTAPFEYTGENIVLRIRGIRRLINAFDPNTIVPTINLAGIEPGEQDVLLQAKLPTGIYFDGDQLVKITIEAPIEEPIEELTEELPEDTPESDPDQPGEGNDINESSDNTES